MHTHQILDVMKVLEGVCKSVVEVGVEDQASEVIANAFRTARKFSQGATAVALPIDLIQSISVGTPPFPSYTFDAPSYGLGDPGLQRLAVEKLLFATCPVILLGMRCSSNEIVATMQQLTKDFNFPVVETFQAAGAISEDLLHRFYGRVGLFRNQPGDKLFARADLVLAVRYDPFEYDTDL